MDLKARLGKRLKTLRDEADLSQEELAHASGLSRVFVGILERGEKAATVDTLEKLARALGLSASSLLQVEEKRRGPSPEERLAKRVSVLAKGATVAEVARFERVARAFFRK